MEVQGDLRQLRRMIRWADIEHIVGLAVHSFDGLGGPQIVVNEIDVLVTSLYLPK